MDDGVKRGRESSDPSLSLLEAQMEEWSEQREAWMRVVGLEMKAEVAAGQGQKQKRKSTPFRRRGYEGQPEEEWAPGPAQPSFPRRSASVGDHHWSLGFPL